MEAVEAIIAVTLILLAVAGLAMVIYTRGHVTRVRSGYSEMLICDEGPFRMLFFVGEKGERDLESAMDRRSPDRLVLSYSKTMMACHLFSPRLDRCLMLGLGGASMVRFLNRHFPDMQIDAVEIDPEVERVAREYFSLTSHPKTRIFIGDGLRYLQQTTESYDVIHVDAFLKASVETDSLGVPLRLKNEAFYAIIRKSLTRNGLVVFNMNYSLRMEEDRKLIAACFPWTYRFALPGLKNEVLIASTNPRRSTSLELERNAAVLDALALPDMDFREMASRLMD